MVSPVIDPSVYISNPGAPYTTMSQDINSKLQQANDMLQAVERQRNHAMNECVTLAAQIAAMQRRIAELEREPEVMPPRVTNGHAHPHDEARP
jgi:peptidoglycan hydrolase CwlO-like protein